MAKYDTYLQELGTLLTNSKKVLVALPMQSSVDELASGLALFLALQKSGKDTSIVSEANLQVAHTNLFGIGEIKNQIPQGSGNFVISLDGVVDPSGQMPGVPALEKLDWYPQGSSLNLVFHVVPGQRFEPTKVNSSYENQGFDLIFTVGVSNLNELANLYINNTSLFGQAPVVNVDNSQTNQNYGKINIVDHSASSISEMMIQIIQSLGMGLDPDIATNIISGIYDSTSNLTQKVSADTFIAVGQAMQLGAKLPQNGFTQQPQQQPVPQPQVQPQAQQAPVQAVSSNPFLAPDQNSFFAPPQSFETVPAQTSQPVQASVSIPAVSQTASPLDANNQGVDLRQIFQIPQMPSSAQSSSDFIVPSVPAQEPQKIVQSSPEEKPMGEYVSSSSPEMDSKPAPDWLVPKIFKSGSVG